MKGIKMNTFFKLFNTALLAISISILTGCGTQQDDHAEHDHAMHDHTAHEHADRQVDYNAVGQTLCPVMDAPIDKKYFVEYQGKTVYFCCPGCEEQFLAEPEKYLHKLPQFQQ